MKSTRRVSLICLTAFSILFLILLINAILTQTLDVSTLVITPIFIFMICMWLIKYIHDSKLVKILDGASAEHKMDDANVVILQTGYIRMRVDIGAGNKSPFRSNLQIFVNIPVGKDAQTTKTTLETIINEITAGLNSEGLLVSSKLGINTTDDDDNKPQRVFPFYIIVSDKIKPARFGQLYQSLLTAITDNGCNDIEQFTITGTDNGSVYRHYRGNLCIGTIECEYDNRVILNSSLDRYAYFGENEDEISEQQYNELRDSIEDDGFNMTLGETTKYFKQILKKTGKGIRVSMADGKKYISVSISNKKSSENIHIINQDGLWWVYGTGYMVEIPVLSTENECDATRMILRLIINIIEGLQNS